MKKTLALLAVAIFISQSAFAACPVNSPCETKKPCQEKCTQHNVAKGCENPKMEKTCKTPEKNTMYEDNKCFFDNEYKAMKKVLCLSPQQESAIDCIYDKFKNQMQIIHMQANEKQNYLCKAINNGDKCNMKTYKKELKQIRKEAIEQYKCFTQEVKAQLCKDQIKCLNRFNRAEKRKMKQLAKYCTKPHFPCDCGSKMHSACGCN